MLLAADRKQFEEPNQKTAGLLLTDEVQKCRPTDIYTDFTGTPNDEQEFTLTGVLRVDSKADIAATPATRPEDSASVETGTPELRSPASSHKSDSETSIDLQEDRLAVAALAKETALDLQQSLLAEFTSPSFQKTLHELARKYRATYGRDASSRAAFKNLVRTHQYRVLPRYGFESSDEGVEAMLKAFAAFQGDGDVFVNTMSINEALFNPSKDLEPPSEEVDIEGTPYGSLPTSKTSILGLLQNLLIAYSEPWFQEEIENLKHDADVAAGRVKTSLWQAIVEEDPAGYYHLPGRSELAMEVQVDILRDHGFEGNTKGVRDMICHCSSYLCDLEVAKLFDSINMKLGMSKTAAKRFRSLAEMLAETSANARLQRTWHRRAAVTHAQRQFEVICVKRAS